MPHPITEYLRLARERNANEEYVRFTPELFDALIEHLEERDRHIERLEDSIERYAKDYGVKGLV